MHLLKYIFIHFFICVVILNTFRSVLAQDMIMKNRGFEYNLQNEKIIQKRLYTTEDGMASNVIRGGIQDDEGFIWLATRNGLNRFDGKNFKLFNTQKGKLTYNDLHYICKDDNRHLFLGYGTKKNASLYNANEVFDLATQKIIPLKTAYPNLPFHPDSLIETNNVSNKLYFFVAPAQIWELTKNTFILKTDLTKYIDNKNLKKYNTLKGDYIFYQNNKILVCYVDEKIPIILITDDKIQIIPKKYTIAKVGYGYFLDFNGNLVINTPTQNKEFRSYRLNTQGDTLSKINFPPIFPKENYTFISDDIAFDEDRKVIIQPKNKQKIYYFHYNRGRVSPILEDNVNSFEKFEWGDAFDAYFQDKQKNIWLCTRKGLIKISIYKSKFEHYFTGAINDPKLENQARGIYADSLGNVYANIWDKILKKNKDGQVLEITNPTIGNALDVKDSLVYCLGKRLYIAEKKFQQTPTTINIAYIRGKNVWAFYFLSKDEIIIGAEGLVIYHLKNEEIHILENSNFPKNVHIYRFFKDKENVLWAVAQNGLYVIKDKKIINYYGFEAKETQYQLPCKDIVDVYLDDKDIFWIATYSNGLYRWDKKINTFQQFTISEGLPSNILTRLESDAYGYLWIGTENGLCRFNKKTFEINTYTTKDGLPHNEFNRISSFKATNGKLYFGGLNGVVAFNPKDFLTDKQRFIIPLKVIGFSQFDGKTEKIIDKTLEFLQQQTITLYPSDRFVEISLQLLNYEEGENRYAYKIEGIDKDWYYTTNNTLRFSGLPYGKFNLRIKAQNYWGIWSEQELKIPIEIVIPIYLRTWFLILSFLLITLAIFVFIRWRIYKIGQEKIALERIVTQRTEELQNNVYEKELLLKELHHRIKNNFSLILSFVYQQSVINQNNHDTIENLNALHQRISSISKAHDLIIESYDTKLASDNLYIDEYLNNIMQAVLGLDKRHIILNFEVEKYLLNTDTSIPLGILLNELLSNSLKHAQPKNEFLIISTKVLFENETIIFDFLDNGISFNETKRKNSFGMTIINSMVKQLKGKMQRTGSHYQFYLQIKNK